MNLSSGTSYDLTVDNLVVKKKLLVFGTATFTDIVVTGTATINELIVTTFNNPLLTAKGDLLTSNGTINVVKHVGTDGQVLSADSAQSSGLSWVNASSLPGVLPTTTKGDLVVYSTTNVRQPVGSNGQVLTADSAQTTGVKWAYPVAAKGGLLTNNGTNSVEQSVGSNGQLLIADSTQSTGLRWFSPSVPLSGATYKIGTKTANQSLPDATTTLLTWQTSDNSANFSSFNVPTAGFYYVHLSCAIDVGGGTVTSRVLLRSVNRSLNYKVWNDYSVSPSSQTIDVSAIIRLNSGDIAANTDFSWFVQQSSGGAKNVLESVTIDAVATNATFYEFFYMGS